MTKVQNTRLIPLTQGKFVVVDEEDYELLSKFKWRAQKSGRSKTYYAVREIKDSKGKEVSVLMHRLVVGAASGKLVDHRDHNGLNNTKTNLRVCSPSQNGGNSRKGKGTTSRFKGVSWSQRNKWLAQIHVNRKTFYLGLFRSEEKAALAYNAAALKRFGEFALLNRFE